LFGWFYLVFLIAPILSTIGIKVLSINPFLYLVVWLPYSVLILSVFFITHIEKGAPVSTVFYNMSVNVVLFTLSISVSLSLLMGKKKAFVTARTGGTLPWYKFTPQFIIMSFLAFSAALLVVKDSIYNYITAFWALFDFVLLLPIFFMNREPRNSLMDSALLVKN
jgi:cellulose synthase (UDP-forming)